jgi:hypothetical protein
MTRKIIINENSQLAYISDDLIKDGYKGEVDIIANFNSDVVVLLKPGSNKEAQILALKLIIKGLESRKETGDVSESS